MPAARLLRHERLRPLPAAGARVPGVLGARAAVLLAGRRLPVLDARHDRALARAPGALRAARLHAAVAVRRRRSARSPFGRARRLHLLQHQRPQPLHDAARRGRRGRPTTRRSTRRSRPTPQPKITAVTLAVDLYPARAARADARHATRSRTRPRQPVDAVHLLLRSSASRLTFDQLEFGVPADARRRTTCDVGVRTLPARHAAARRARRRRSTFDLELPTRGFTQRQARTPPSSTTASFVNGNVRAAAHRLPGARRARDATATARSSASRPRSGCATATTRPASPINDLAPRRRLHRLRGDGQHRAPTRSRSRRATCSASGPRTGAATSTTRWTRRSSNFFAFQSARYAVKKDRWNDVAIEIYYQPGPRVQPRPR